MKYLGKFKFISIAHKIIKGLNHTSNPYINLNSFIRIIAEMFQYMIQQLTGLCVHS